MMRTIKMMILAWGLCIPAYAQEELRGDRVQVRGIFGATGFYESNTHKAVGVMTDIRLIAGLRVGPEVMYHIDFGHRDVTTTALVSYDFARLKRVTAYLTGGGGVLFQKSSRSRWTSNDLTFGGGGGVRIAISNRLFIAPELRLGWEPLAQATVSIGYRF